MKSYIDVGALVVIGVVIAVLFLVALFGKPKAPAVPPVIKSPVEHVSPPVQDWPNETDAKG